MKLVQLYSDSMILIHGNTDRTINKIFQTDQLFIIGTLLVIEIVFWFLIEPKEMQKWVKIFTILFGVIFILKNYFMFIRIGEDRIFLPFLDYFVGRYGLFALLYTPMLILALKSKPKSKGTKNH